IEKAHPDVFNILLQVMDYGKLTDNNGKTVDFRNVVLIMTTNAGAADMAKPAMGFGSSVRQNEDKEAINRLFTPEFRNRLDAVIPFAGLTPAIVRNVVDKFVKELGAQLADRRVSIEVDDLARDWLAEKGYEPLFGARPLARLIQEKIKRPLADELLFGRLVKGGKVVVTIEDGEPAFQITPTGGGPALLPKPGPAADDDEEEEDDQQLTVDA
uniref:AAA family ATPase n=1 Tax=Geminicoccus flavidas TaxID=2506407 RepID=UPI00135CCA2C